MNSIEQKAYAEFEAESCQSAFLTMCRLPKLFRKINSTVLFGRNLKEGPGDLDNF